MIAGDQSEVLAFLNNPGSYPRISSVDRIDTHTASVFLAGDRAYKLKRAVRYDYLDFSTLERRRAACQSEVSLNRRTAPQLYVGATAITRGVDGALQWGDHGDEVDWVVVMRRFAQDDLLDRVATASRFSLPLARRLADQVAAFHAGAERRPFFGGSAGIDAVIVGNEQAFMRGGPDPELAQRVTRRSRELLAHLGPLLDERQAAGFVRQCHGDLHLRNIVLLDQDPTIFDAIEFNDAFACVDVLYDLAFLIMDLLARDLPLHANVVFNRYLAQTDNIRGTALMPLFLSLRAAIRAKTSLSAAELAADSDSREQLVARAARYLALADRLPAPEPPRLIAIGGFSGSGKSTLAERLAPRLGAAPGAVVLRTDLLRRRLFAKDLGQPVLPDAYTPRHHARVYDVLRSQANAALSGGMAVIVDGVFADAFQRQAIPALANIRAVPFTGIWLDVPPAVMRRRIEQRHGDASDATESVLERQLAAGHGAVDWERLPADDDVSVIEQRALTLLSAQQEAVL